VWHEGGDPESCWLLILLAPAVAALLLFLLLPLTLLLLLLLLPLVLLHSMRYLGGAHVSNHSSLCARAGVLERSLWSSVSRRR
jgi:hypothetical protein